MSCVWIILFFFCLSQITKYFDWLKFWVYVGHSFKKNENTLSLPGATTHAGSWPDSRSRLQPSLSLALLLQFLTPSLSASLITPSVYLRFGLPTRFLPSGLSKVIFLHGKLSCFRTICPAHLSLVILIAVTKSVSSYRRYNSSLYLDLRIAPPQIGP